MSWGCTGLGGGAVVTGDDKEVLLCSTRDKFMSTPGTKEGQLYRLVCRGGGGFVTGEEGGGAAVWHVREVLK